MGFKDNYKELLIQSSGLSKGLSKMWNFQIFAWQAGFPAIQEGRIVLQTKLDVKNSASIFNLVNKA